jgi:N-methylhydantoinase B/oxoprolinase/acetone carboxylase alpha subunit
MRYWVCEECGAGLSTEDDREVARCTGGPSALVVTNMGGSYDVRPTEVLSGGKGGGSGYVTVTQSTHWPLVMKEITSLVNNPDDLRRILAGQFGGGGGNGRVEWAALEKDDVESSNRAIERGWSGGWD